jgi:hypothetical protein
MADMDCLLREAHRRGIGIIIDYVLNHASAAHPLFRSAAASPRSPHRGHFVWAPGAGPPGWEIFGRNPWHPAPAGPDSPGAGAGNWSYFAPFWSGMPDFNLRNPAAVAFHRDNLRFWLNRQACPRPPSQTISPPTHLPTRFHPTRGKRHCPAVLSFQPRKAGEFFPLKGLKSLKTSEREGSE